MMPKIHFSGQWKGEFTYGPEYGELHGEKVGFILFLEGNGSEFTGKGFDIDGIGAQSEVASIKGFYENGSISFIKQYPKSYAIDQDGTLLLEENRIPPEIHYYGEYNESLKQFTGTWEIVEEEIKEGDVFWEYLSTGTWEMRKEQE